MNEKGPLHITKTVKGGGGGGCASNIKYIQLFYEKYDFTELVEHMNKMFKCFYHK